MTEAKIILHSVNPGGVELITWKWTYWRAIHSEMMTHRAFSRNAASSRAVPVEKMLSAIVEDCAGPVHWGANQSGMQASAVLEGKALEDAQFEWRMAALDALRHAEGFAHLGAHKQIANRVLEPYCHMTALVSMTRPALAHFFGLRAHPDAQPEFQVLAYRALDEYLRSVPEEIPWGAWHIPFGGRMPKGLTGPERLQVATARCARVSYLTQDGVLDVGRDLELYARLSKSDPAHASAFEHCAQANAISPHLFSNFDTGYGGVGGGSAWLQFRKTLPNEFNPRLDLREIMARKPAWVTLGPDAPNPLDDHAREDNFHITVP